MPGSLVLLASCAISACEVFAKCMTVMLCFYNFKFLFKQAFCTFVFKKCQMSVLHVNNVFFYCSIDSIYKMFVYKVLWIFTVKCLQFNKELYVYFVQVPFCESLKTLGST